jgi:DNA-nicking Smr family endonuclease
VRRRTHSRPASPKKPAEFHHQPFRKLGKLLSVAEADPAKPGPTTASVPEHPDDDGAIAFRREMAGVKRLDAESRGRVDVPSPASPAREVVDAEAEALAELSELVAGTSHFDITDSDEHVEGMVTGVDPRLLQRLRTGEFACQAHVDLHGLTAAEARIEIDRFLLSARQAGLRCVLIVHGRGRNSKDQVPVLKNRVVNWLARGRWSRVILAFTSARACDGGSGALYVLLRRDRHPKGAVRVLNGAKW